MSKTTYVMFPIFRSDATARLAARLYVNGARETITELAGALGVSVPAVSAIVKVLEKAGLVTVIRAGTAKYVAANTQAPFYRPLHELLEVVAGPPVVVAEEFAGVAGIRDLWICGSWAARATGVPGRSPKDIDVLVVGATSRLDVLDAARAATSRLGREVHPIIADAEAWDCGQDAFLGALATEPMIRVLLPKEDNDETESRRTRDGEAAGDWATAGW